MRFSVRADDARLKQRRSPRHLQAMEFFIMSSARKILIVDDDDDLRTSLQEQLALYDEFELASAATAGQGLEQARAGHFDLMILDVSLPDMDGRELCKQLRKSGFKAPIIMLTGNTSDADMILGLDAGANDYVTKPFKLAVLLARIRAQLRQHEQSEDAVFTIGHFTFKPAAKLLVDEKGSKTRLTEKETSILKYLLPRRREGGRRAMCCCTRSGATTPASPPTRWRPTSTACARRSRRIRPARSCWSPKRAATSWYPEALLRRYQARK